MNKGFAVQFINNGRALITEFHKDCALQKQTITITRKEFIETMENLYLKFGVVDVEKFQ